MKHHSRLEISLEGVVTSFIAETRSFDDRFVPISYSQTAAKEAALLPRLLQDECTVSDENETRFQLSQCLGWGTIQTVTEVVVIPWSLSLAQYQSILYQPAYLQLRYLLLGLK